MDIDAVKKIMEDSVSTTEAAALLGGIKPDVVRKWCQDLAEGRPSRLKKGEVFQDPVGRYRVFKAALKRLWENPSRQF